MISSTLNKYYAYKFIFLLTQKWEDTKAYKEGIIDKNGNVLKKISQMNSSEKSTYNRFVRLVFSIKRMLQKIPFAQSTIGRYASAVALLQEDYIDNCDMILMEYITENNLQKNAIFQQLPVYFFENVDYNSSNIKTYFGLLFDSDYNLLSEMNTTAGIDMSPVKIKRKDIEESGDDNFAGSTVFNCNSDIFERCRLGKQKYHKYEKYVGSDEFGEKVREYGRTFPQKPIVLRDSITGAMIYLKK